MRLIAEEFSGYGSGVTDFATLLATTPQPALGELETVLDIVAGQLGTPPTPNLFVSLIVVGHSDRQDRTDFTCDQRRTSEIEAARDRAVSAWEWIKARVTAKAAAAGVVAGDWWETSPHVTWGLVFAAAGMLKFPNPSTAERPLNRRVVVLVSIFNPD
jgi:hypothetical protein